MPNTSTENWKEEFYRKFTTLRFGDGSSEGGGKGTYRIVRENLSLDEIVDSIDSLLATREKEMLEAVRSLSAEMEDTEDFTLGFMTAKAKVIALLSDNTTL
jgi:hypothetical protein